MRWLRPILTVIGAIALLIGLLWIGQGLGVVNWPSSSFMLGRQEWAIRGAALAVIGVIVLLRARRR
ncbi:MAG: hypothetical protein ACTHM0_11405 [Sphingomonas sp.]